MIEQQINVVIVITDLNPIFLSDEGKVFADFQNKAFQIVQYGFLQILFRYLFRQVQKIKYIVVKEDVAGVVVSLINSRRKM